MLVNADPFRLRQLAGGSAAFPADFNARLDGLRKDGTTMKARGVGWGGGACIGGSTQLSLQLGGAAQPCKQRRETASRSTAVAKSALQRICLPNQHVFPSCHRTAPGEHGAERAARLLLPA